MDLYLVEKEISFDYRKFPWIKKTIGSVVQKWDMAVIAAESEKEAEKKFLEKHKETSLIGLWKWAVDGTFNIMCKEPNYKITIHVEKLDDDVNVKNLMEYMSLDELKLYIENKNNKEKNDEKCSIGQGSR